MSDNIIQKEYYIGKKSLFPPVTEGNVLFDTEEHGLYIDSEDERHEIGGQYWNILSEPVPTWEEIIANQNYATDYQLGMLMNLDFGEYGVHPMELVAIDADDKADGTGKARMTWISKDIITIRNMNEQWDKSGGWENSDLRSWLIEEVINDIPQLVANNIIQVNKTYLDGNDTKTCTDNIWIPSCNEVFHTDSYYGNKYENSGCKYDEAFPFVEHPETQSVDYSSQTRLYNGNECRWWTRTKKSHLYTCISSHGGGEDKYAYDELGIVIGFCL